MKVLALFSVQSSELGAAVGAQCEGLGWVAQQGVGCWSAPTAPWPSLWADGGYVHGFLCVSGSVINVMMQDMRHDFNSFCFFRRITHFSSVPGECCSYKAALSSLPNESIFQRCGNKVPQLFQVEMISRPLGEQTKVNGLIVFLGNKAVAISVFLVLDIFLQRTTKVDWTDVRRTPKLRLWLL